MQMKKILLTSIVVNFVLCATIICYFVIRDISYDKNFFVYNDGQKVYAGLEDGGSGLNNPGFSVLPNEKNDGKEQNEAGTGGNEDLDKDVQKEDNVGDGNENGWNDPCGFDEGGNGVVNENPNNDEGLKDNDGENGNNDNEGQNSNGNSSDEEERNEQSDLETEPGAEVDGDDSMWDD